MKLKVKSTVGLATPVEVEVEPTETVREIKDKVAAMQACDANGIALQHNGKPMNESSRIKEYGINEGETIEVIPKNRQGGILPPSFFKNRISQESQQIKKEGISLYPINPFLWRGTIYGKGKRKGKYEISISLSSDYPYRAPTVKWETPLYPNHPNIFYTGGVCLNILGKDWRPQYTLVTVYRSLEWLLEHPNHENLPILPLGRILNVFR